MWKKERRKLGKFSHQSTFSYFAVKNQFSKHVNFTKQLMQCAKCLFFMYLQRNQKCFGTVGNLLKTKKNSKNPQKIIFQAKRVVQQNFSSIFSLLSNH